MSFDCQALAKRVEGVVAAKTAWQSRAASEQSETTHKNIFSARILVPIKISVDSHLPSAYIFLPA